MNSLAHALIIRMISARIYKPISIGRLGKLNKDRKVLMLVNCTTSEDMSSTYFLYYGKIKNLIAGKSSLLLDFELNFNSVHVTKSKLITNTTLSVSSHTLIRVLPYINPSIIFNSFKKYFIIYKDDFYS